MFKKIVLMGALVVSASHGAAIIAIPADGQYIAGFNDMQASVLAFDAIVEAELLAGRPSPARNPFVPADISVTGIFGTDEDGVRARGIFAERGLVSGNPCVYNSFMGGAHVGAGRVQPVEVFRSVQLSVLVAYLTNRARAAEANQIDSIISAQWILGAANYLSGAAAPGAPVGPDGPMGRLQDISVQFFLYPLNGVGGIVQDRLGITFTQGVALSANQAQFHANFGANIGQLINAVPALTVAPFVIGVAPAADPVQARDPAILASNFIATNPAGTMLPQALAHDALDSFLAHGEHDGWAIPDNTFALAMPVAETAARLVAAQAAEGNVNAAFLAAQAAVPAGFVAATRADAEAALVAVQAQEVIAVAEWKIANHLSQLLTGIDTINTLAGNNAHNANAAAGLVSEARALADRDATIALVQAAQAEVNRFVAEEAAALLAAQQAAADLLAAQQTVLSAAQHQQLVAAQEALAGAVSHLPTHVQHHVLAGNLGL